MLPFTLENTAYQTFTVTVLARHSPDCPQAKNPKWKRCNCRKQLYIYENGKASYKSVKTRSWEEAARAAQVERDLRDPVKMALREKARKEEERAASEAADVQTECTMRNLADRQKLYGAPSSRPIYYFIHTESGSGT